MVPLKRRARNTRHTMTQSACFTAASFLPKIHFEEIVRALKQEAATSPNGFGISVLSVVIPLYSLRRASG